MYLVLDAFDLTLYKLFYSYTAYVTSFWSAPGRGTISALQPFVVWASTAEVSCATGSEAWPMPGQFIQCNNVGIAMINSD